MANHGSASKFVSVNLNKSYGQVPTSSSNAAHAPRSAHHGGGGGMLVLSRFRTSISSPAKAAAKISVPPPLNLPSLRKEHERFDQSSVLGGPPGARTTGSGSGLGSAAGWLRPVLPTTLPDKDASSGGAPPYARIGAENSRVGSPGGSAYLSPSARFVPAGQQRDSTAGRNVVPAEKELVLRGEDFPTLHATLRSAAPSVQRQKDVSHHKLKQSDEAPQECPVSSDSRLLLHMRPPMCSSRLVVGGNSNENGRGSHASSGLHSKEKLRKPDSYLPGPLPHLRLHHTSDWDDDERDTGLAFSSRETRGRDHGFMRTEVSWERGFGIPRGGLPQKFPVDLSDGRSLCDDFAKFSAREVRRGDPYGSTSRDGSSWRVTSPLVKEGVCGRDTGINRYVKEMRPFSPSSREMGVENKFSESAGREAGGNHAVNGTQDYRYARRDSGYGVLRHNGNCVTETLGSRGVEHNSHSCYSDLPNRTKGDTLQSSSMAKPFHSLGSKGNSIKDPIPKFGKEKRLFSYGGKPYMEDSFDGRDPFIGGLIGDTKIFKRKKDAIKQADFHDPVRELFEAELERVQKIQEQERQRIAEEQARALELAQREEEERQRLAREEEERHRRLEEEVREAAWRAEQERLEAVRRVEQQKIAREEEKRKMFMEEERRKEAARRKLLELEARMAARRQSEAARDDNFVTLVGEEKMPGLSKGRDASRVANVGELEDGERMVERLTSSASSDSSNLNRSIDTGSRPHSSRDGSSYYLDRGKHSNFWSRDPFENGSSSSFLSPQDQENGFYSRCDGVGVGRVYPRKDFYGGPGVMSYRSSTKGGMSDPQMFDDYPQMRGQRWNLGGDGDHYNRNTEHDAEYPDSSIDKFGDIGWGHGPPRGSASGLYADRSSQNNDVDGFSSFGRSRHSMRQPRVLPPPSLPSVDRSTYRTESDHPNSSVYLNEGSRYMHNARRNEHIMSAGFESGYQDTNESSGVVNVVERTMPNELKNEKHSPRCDSQSSLSVSSPPDSPAHLSHDELDDLGDFSLLPAADGRRQMALSDSENASASEEITTSITSGMVSTDADDKWAAGTNGELQGHEEYEEGGTYHEEDDVHEGDNENLNVAPQYENLHSREQIANGKSGRVDLGFDEGVEVEMHEDNEIENAHKNADEAIEQQAMSVGMATIGQVENEHGSQAMNGISESAESSSKKLIDETEKSLQELNIQSPVSSPSYILDNVENPSSSGKSDAQTVVSTANLSVTSQPVQPILLAASAVQSQAEVPPVKLQFGLFSGPSLIPSPVPAIQIGSIQMPLLHPQVQQPLTHVHPSQPPFFQFGQLRYSSPVSQGILPLAPQTLTFAQPAGSAPYSHKPSPGGSLLNKAVPGISSQSLHLNEAMDTAHMDNKPNPVSNIKSPHENTNKEPNTSSAMSNTERVSLSSHSQGDVFVENRTVSESISKIEEQGCNDKTLDANFRFVASNKDAQGLPHKDIVRDSGCSKASGAVPSGKGRRFVYAVRNTGSRSNVCLSEGSHLEPSGFPRRARRNMRRPEFKVRETLDRRQAEGSVSSKYSRVDEKSSSNGRTPGMFVKSGNKRDAVINKSTKPLVESETFLTSGSLSLRVVDAESRMNRAVGKYAPSKRLISAGETSCSGEGNHQNNMVFEDVDAPLQTGVVRVFKQPGIEAPSDEDDFIEVRSKRQMVNDRREQREKEIKVKSRVIKAPRKPRSVSQTIGTSGNSSRASTLLGGEVVNGVLAESMANDGWASANDEVSTGFSTGMTSPPLAPIGTPANSTGATSERRSLSMKSINTTPSPVVSSGGTNLVQGVSFEEKDIVLDNIITPFSSWASVCTNQQVMALTQTQLDEAMKPARFDTQFPPCNFNDGALEPGKASASKMAQDPPFSSSTSPLSCLLAGEKIQFGAVTSPTILPPRCLPVQSDVGPPGQCRSDVSTDHKLSVSEGECSILYNKEKPDPCVQLVDPEAEAEAAASAVAVAAISSDELVGNGLGASVSVSDPQSFGNAGVVGDQQSPSQSRGEESLTVALPADLSVETPSLSLWPALPSPHTSSGPMLSHFPGAPPPHYPCYEMNPMLGGPIFAFGPHDESAVTQSQSQKSSPPGSGSLGAWQPCHSGVDSFYGPAGFTGPFISPGGIPGVQGSPHMVIYNHFSPVGQFGQVGLSFMGTTYIPSGKQPDWKHTPVSSAVGISEGDIHNLNISSVQQNPSSIPASIQHLAPGSPLLPMASPLAMFDLSPFQSTADASGQARWSHVPSSPLQPVPSSTLPLQQPPVEGGLPSQFGHGLSVDTPNVKTFPETPSAPANRCRVFSPTSGSTSQFSGEGLTEPSNAASSHVPGSRPALYNSVNGNGSAVSFTKNTSRVPTSDTSQSGIVSNSSVGPGNNSGSLSINSSSLMAPAKQPQNSSAPHYPNPIGHTEQRGGISQKNSSGSDWHRRVGFQARNQTSGSDKNFTSSKMKQIYVAKPTSTVPSSTA